MKILKISEEEIENCQEVSLLMDRSEDARKLFLIWSMIWPFISFPPVYIFIFYLFLIWSMIWPFIYFFQLYLASLWRRAKTESGRLIFFTTDWLLLGFCLKIYYSEASNVRSMGSWKNVPTFSEILMLVGSTFHKRWLKLNMKKRDGKSSPSSTVWWLICWWVAAGKKEVRLVSTFLLLRSTPVSSRLTISGLFSAMINSSLLSSSSSMTTTLRSLAACSSSWSLLSSSPSSSPPSSEFGDAEREDE